MSAKGASLAQVKELRERTGAGVVDCQRLSPKVVETSKRRSRFFGKKD